jgi:hypothetical protein
MRAEAVAQEGASASTCSPRCSTSTSSVAWASPRSRTICAHCPVQAECREEGIISPLGQKIRGGAINIDLWRVHARWMDEHVEIYDLVDQSIAGQRPLRGDRGFKRLRRGDFNDMTLAFQEMGGAS